MLDKLKLLAFILAIIPASNLKAQVTVGSDNVPNLGALLDLKEDNVTGKNAVRGLGLPRVHLEEHESLYPMFNKDKSDATSYKDKDGNTIAARATADQAHTGLTVFNVNPVYPFCIGVYVWYGDIWVRLPEDCPVPPEPPVDPETLLDGVGIIDGKRCFDIVETNDSNPTRANFELRKGQKTDFSKDDEVDDLQDPDLATFDNPFPYLGTSKQVYTFRPMKDSVVSKVRFMYKNPSGVEAIVAMQYNEADYAGTVDENTKCKVTVTYNNGLNAHPKVLGTTRTAPVQPTIYVIYNDKADGTGVDRKVPLNIRIQDAVCCGARTMEGKWLDFMCYNRSYTDYSDNIYADPLNPSTSLNDFYKNGYYQWGSANSNREVGSMYPDAYINGGQDLTVPPYIWGDGSSRETFSMKKGPKDPCPKGWKIPSAAQWMSLFTGIVEPGEEITYAESKANTLTALGPLPWSEGKNTGMKIGEYLLLPALGHCTTTGTGTVERGTYGRYVTSYHDTTTPKGNIGVSTIAIWDTEVAPYYVGYKPFGFSLRCIADYQ